MTYLMSVRFAPSPTGLFHLGNLRTALISYAWARALKLPWVVRMEDIDTPRVISGMAEMQLADMAQLRMKPDRYLLQSGNSARHERLFVTARNQGVIYPCICSRKDVKNALHQSASAPHSAPATYSGHCRHSSQPTSFPHPVLNWRFRAADESGKNDFLIGHSKATHHAFEQAETFTPAYHWACAIDDYDGDHQLLVRAWDLAPATPIQRMIFQWLCQIEKLKPLPAVFHTSLVTQNNGRRLEKRTQGVTLSELLSPKLTSTVLLKHLRSSFQIHTDEFSPEKNWGEVNRTLKLADIIKEFI